MDFFEHQEKARRHTKLLVFYFGVAVTLIILCVYLVCAAIFFKGELIAGNPGALWNLKLFLAVTTGTLAVVCFGSAYKIAELRSGGGAVARMLGGRLISPVTSDPDEKKLRNVIEEMALASGVPVPEIYVLDAESGINAFAAGHATSDAAVCVTRGCMQLRTRDELQGVIAHEFSHMLNGDMRLNLRLMGLINGILCLAIIGRILLNTTSSRSSSDRKGGNPLPLVGLALLVVGGIGVFFGKLIKSAVSRQREFLADASAVQFTRNPSGLAGALKKIGGLSTGSRLENPEAESASHLFFANGLSDSWSNLFATHPSLEERIRLLEPTFDGKFQAIEPLRRAPADEVSQLMPGSQAAPPIRPAMGGAIGLRPVRPQSFIRRAGQFTPKHLAYAVEVRAALPEPLVAASRETFGAVAVAYSLLLSSDWATRVAQMETLKASCEPGIVGEMERLAPSFASLAMEAQLPLLLVVIPTLRLLSQPQYTSFKQNVEKIINSDGVIDLTEFARQKLLIRNVEARFAKQGSRSIQYYAWQPLLGDAAIVLSALAWAGQSTAEAASKAFDMGWDQLRAAQVGTILTAQEASVSQVDVALNRLAVASPFIKKSMLDACAFTVAADEKICPPEAELLRAIADLLDCPLPPFIEGV